jgi:hypothetical protein
MIRGYGCSDAVVQLVKHRGRGLGRWRGLHASLAMVRRMASHGSRHLVDLDQRIPMTSHTFRLKIEATNPYFPEATTPYTAYLWYVGKNRIFDFPPCAL